MGNFWFRFGTSVVVMVVAFVIWRVVESRRARSAWGSLSPQMAEGLATIDRAVAAFIKGQHPTDELLRACGQAVQDFYEYLAVVTGQRDNSKFPVDDQARFYLTAVKVAAMDHPDHNAWPLKAGFRRNVVTPLKARLAKTQDPWVALALVTPALLRGDIELAVSAYRDLPPALAEVAVGWAREAAIGDADYNHAPTARRFLAQVGASEAPSSPEPVALSDAQRWALSALIYPSFARDPRVTLGAPLSPAVCRLTLERWWHVTSEASALDMLESLLSSGHRAELADDLSGELSQSARADWARSNASALQVHQILAWDLCRLINVARNAVTAGYLSAEQAWSFILPAAQALQAEYASWDELGADYLLGFRYFEGGDDPDPAHRGSVEWLQQSPLSPWRRLPWSLPLGS